MRKTRFSDYYLEDGEDIKKRVVLVPPNKERVIGLGIYPNGQPEPDFEIDLDPQDMEDYMGISWDRHQVPDEDKYFIIALIRNFDSKPCTVTLRRVERLNDGRR